VANGFMACIVVTHLRFEIFHHAVFVTLCFVFVYQVKFPTGVSVVFHVFLIPQTEHRVI